MVFSYSLPHLNLSNTPLRNEIGHTFIVHLQTHMY